MMAAPEGTPCDHGDDATAGDACDAASACVGPPVCDSNAGLGAARARIAVTAVPVADRGVIYYRVDVLAPEG